MDMTNWTDDEVDALVSLARSGLRWDAISARMGMTQKACRYKWNEVATQQERQDRSDARYHFQLTGEAVIRPRLAPGETGIPVGIRFGEENIVEYGRLRRRQTPVYAESSAAWAPR